MKPKVCSGSTAVYSPYKYIVRFHELIFVSNPSEIEPSAFFAGHLEKKQVGFVRFYFPNSKKGDSEK
jgi:hypothetical protein